MNDAEAQERLEALLLEGIESEVTEFTREDFAEIRQEALAKLSQPPEAG
jgi:hypothetical protein